VPSDPVELTRQIKAACDIVAVVGGYLRLTPAGVTFKALCPFHNDSRPSLDIDPRRQRYKCWSCGAHGDVFSFVQHMEKIGFREARQILANRAGIKLDESPSPQDLARTRLLGVMRWAHEKYQKFLLDDPAAAAARTYLGERKLSGKTVRDFGLGFAPLTGDWLARLAAEESISDEILVEVGLTAPSQGGRGYYDRFRDRIMFPIRDVQSRPIGFGGRIMPESPLLPRAPKYYNSTETPLFSKSDVLYGLDLARHAAAAVEYLAVVEGYTDVMMAHQCGIPQVVATMGTALNARHVAQLRRYTPKVVLVYDADAGGMTGVDRALEIFVSQDVELAVATLPEGLDPCDLLVQPDGSETFKRILNSAVDALDFKLNRLLDRDSSPSVEATRRIIDEVLGIMAAAPERASRSSQVKQELIVTRLAHRLGLRQETVWARLGELRNDRRREDRGPVRPRTGLVMIPAEPDGLPVDDSPPARVGPVVALERQLLGLLLASPWLVPAAAAGLSPDEISHTGLRRMLAELYSIQAAGLSPDLDSLRERLLDRPDLFEAARKLHDIGHQVDREADARTEWLGVILKRFADLKTEAERRRLREQLEAQSSDEDAAVELLRKLQQTARSRGESPHSTATRNN
jgi:DNA primase